MLHSEVYHVSEINEGKKLVNIQNLYSMEMKWKENEKERKLINIFNYFISYVVLITWDFINVFIKIIDTYTPHLRYNNECS